MSEGYNGLPSYYIQSADPITPNLGLSLKGMDPIVALNFVTLDTAVGGGGSTININGSPVSNPNFNGTTPAAPANSVNVQWQVSGSSVSGYVPFPTLNQVQDPTATKAFTFPSGASLQLKGSALGNADLYLINTSSGNQASPRIFFEGSSGVGTSNEVYSLGVQEGTLNAGHSVFAIAYVGSGTTDGLWVPGGIVVSQVTGTNPVFLTTTTTELNVSARVSATTGFQIGGAAATAGHYLRGDGTNYVDGTIQPTDLPAGIGTVTSFSAGALSPLFTTSVATATTTPALSFTLSTQSANLVFAGPTTGAAAAPTFRSLVAADLPTVPANKGGTGIDSSAGTGVAQVLAGTWSINTALANGTTATTQAVGNNSTKVATTAYVDAEALIVTAAPGYAGIPIDYWNAASSAGATSTNLNNATTAFMIFSLNRTVTFTKMTVNMTAAGSSSNQFLVGIYNAAGTTKIVQGTFTSTGSTGVYTATVSSTTLTPGFYVLAFAVTVSATCRCSGIPTNGIPGAVINNTTVRMGTTTNAPSAGVLPSNLFGSGVISGNTALVAPFVLLEP